MASSKTFRGYDPEQGYDFLRETIVKNDFIDNQIDISINKIFISDGAKCDCGNIEEIFSLDNVVAITDPVYPVYLDINVMAGRTGKIAEDEKYKGLVYLPCNKENNFIPPLPKEGVDLIYLRFPNNPTGTTFTKDQLAVFVDYAKENKAITLFDTAYKAFISEDNVPHSIYEIEGAKEVAIEFRGFSKTAGFTGTRAVYNVVLKEFKAHDAEGNTHSVNSLWNRGQTTKFNRVSYPVQRATEAIYSEEGKKEVQANIDYYMENAKIIRKKLAKTELDVFGGVNSPYIWVKTPNKMPSWDFFDLLLNEANILGTHGEGFGPSGEGYLRLTAFNTLENIKLVMERISKLSF